jgi:thiosulfate/3-mercaptopyruvate sulfurtransferase
MASAHPLIVVTELGELIAREAALALMDARWSPAGPAPLDQYRAGHLPGAGYCSLDTDLSAPPGARGRHPLPSAGAFQAALRRIEVNASDLVVVYDQRDSTIWARLWWMLRYFGHDDVQVLDGGYEAWVRAGMPIETGDGVAKEDGDFVASRGGMPIVTASDVQALARRGVLLDARLAERYRGEVEPLDLVAGHIPGAVSAPTFGNTDADGMFLRAGELRERFAALGIAPGTEVAAYCGSGVTAAHEVLALRLAGFDAALYVGSWSEWIAGPVPRSRARRRVIELSDRPT